MLRLFPDQIPWSGGEESAAILQPSAPEICGRAQLALAQLSI